MIRYKTLLLTVVVALLTGCGNAISPTAGEGEERQTGSSTEEIPEVHVIPLKKSVFNHELVSNGKLSARDVADLWFQSQQEPVIRIYVKNGERVAKGQRLAELDLFRLSNKRQQAFDAMERAKLDLQDVLIGQGYALADSARIPEKTLQLARVKSGYSQTLAQYELARFDEENGVLIAPFAGVVANLSLKEYNKPVAADPFCRIVNIEQMEVEFTALESELPLIRVGDRVQIVPYADPSVKAEGSVAVINPVVNENGMVKIKALVKGAPRLFEGGNVRVNVRRAVEGKLVVPKSAVVMRSGRQVLFTYVDGKAFWNYVQTELENATQYVVSGETLKEGDRVIIDNNINLAHESPVKLLGDEAK